MADEVAVSRGMERGKKRCRMVLLLGTASTFEDDVTIQRVDDMLNQTNFACDKVEV